MKKIISGRILALIMMMCVLCSTFITASALPENDDADGSIEIRIAAFAEGTEIGLYKVALLNEQAQYVLFEEYEECDVDLSDLSIASKSQMAADKLAEYAVNSEQEKSVLVNSEGIALFDKVEASNILYLVCQKNNEEVISISPMLVLLPYYDDNEEMHKAAVIDAKYEDNRVTELKGAIILNKTDDKNSPLADAVFKFEKKVYNTDESANQDESQYSWETVSEALVTDKNGQIVAEQLPLGEYRFIETKAPKGYILDSTPYDAVVKDEATIKIENNKYVADEGKPVILTVVNKSEPSESSVPVESSIVSEPSVSVPPPSETVLTGDDIAKFIIIGIIVAVSLVAVILLFVLGRKKKDDNQV